MSASVTTAVFVAAFALFACGDNQKPSMPDGGMPGTEAPVEVRCETLPAATAADTCSIQMGGAAKLIKGNVLTPTTVYLGGRVAVDEMGKIACVGCDCTLVGATTITCPDAVISPGLINTHDHITFDQNAPYTDTGERYEDRQQWREGLDHHHDIPAPGGANGDQISWAELRFLMGGATSIVGSGGRPGLLRNLDIAADMEGLDQLGKKQVEFETFPLDDGSGVRRRGDCDYGGDPDTAASVAAADAYEPHTAEGIDATARNEFLCESSASFDTRMPGASNNLLLPKTAMIHAIGLQPSDYGAMAAAGTALIWSPRSNITLYGDTARVTIADRLGAKIALGTDWVPTGSMNLLRELSCADNFNATYLEHHFRDDQLWAMVTGNAAAVTKTDDVIGVLAAGKQADISIFAAHGKKPFRAVIQAEPKDVALVMRGGKVLYGDDPLVGALAQSCDTVDVCGTGKRVCTMPEVGKTYADLKTAATPKSAPLYPAFACGMPDNEPSCTPKRPVSVAGSTIYDGSVTGSDSDGDGIVDAHDNCPHTFNPVRPVDGGAQGDADGDGVGDACDPCPFDRNTTQCTAFSSTDRDHDGKPDAMDNCPETYNADQANADQDARGDVCDVCATVADVDGIACPTTIYDIKRGMLAFDHVVQLSNVLVTGVGSNGFFVQVKDTDQGYDGPAFSGLFVFTSTAPKTTGTPGVPITAGARVTVDGSPTTFQGQMELEKVVNLQITAAGPEPLPAPVAASYAEISTGGPRAAELEGVVVTVGAATVTATDPTFGAVTVTDGAAHSLVIDGFVFKPVPPLLKFQGFASVTGILAFRQMASKLEIRSAADLAFGVPGIASFGPAKSFVRINPADPTTAVPTFPQPLTVTLTSPAPVGGTTVTLTSGDPTKLTVVDVVIPATATSAPVPVVPVLSGATDIPVTATVVTQTLGAQPPLTSNVRVLGDTEAPTAVTLSPATSSIAPGGSVTFTATLDLPALVTSTVDLAVTPSDAGTLPASVDIGPGTISATFTYKDTSGNPSATVTASFGAGPPSSGVVAVELGVNHLVINEVDYDQPGTDATEFVEIYNPTSSAISLANKALVLVNGANNSTYDTIDLGPATSLPSHQYLVVAGAGVTVPGTAVKLQTSWSTNAIQNGGAPQGDGVALVDTSAHTLIDALSYTGSVTMANIAGFPAPVSLVEGTVLPTTVADNGTAGTSLCRSPNGGDTDVAMADWKVCTTASIGTANPPPPPAVQPVPRE